MQHFLQGRNIISKDKSGKLKCSDLDILLSLQEVRSDFRQKNSYNQTVSAVSKFLSSPQTETLILKSTLFSNSGFINTLCESLGADKTIVSDLAIAVSSQNLKDGQYIFIDLAQEECNKFYIEIINGKIKITDRIKLDIDKLKRVLATKFASTQFDSIFQNLTSYNNLIEANSYLFDCGNDPYETNISEIELSKHFNDTYFSTLFEGITETLFSFYQEHSLKGKTLLLLTPLAAFLPVKQKLNERENLIAISDFDLIGSIPSIKQCNETEESLEINAYPSNRISKSSLSSWVLTETNKLSFQLRSTLHPINSSFEINLNDLKEELSSSFFFLQDKAVVKYHLKIERDCCFNLHLRIDTLDNKVFYYLINN